LNRIEQAKIMQGVDIEGKQPHGNDIFEHAKKEKAEIEQRGWRLDTTWCVAYP
jgi:hypothetical protein